MTPMQETAGPISTRRKAKVTPTASASMLVATARGSMDRGRKELLPGELVDIFKFEEANTDILEKGGRPATAKRTLLGITKAALATDSWLSAASFQETSRVLTEAAIKNKVDPLYGLKENVIIGKQISAGTGLAEYRNVQIKEVVERSDREQF